MGGGGGRRADRHRSECRDALVQTRRMNDAPAEEGRRQNDRRPLPPVAVPHCSSPVVRECARSTLSFGWTDRWAVPTGAVALPDRTRAGSLPRPGCSRGGPFGVGSTFQTLVRARSSPLCAPSSRTMSTLSATSPEAAVPAVTQVEGTWLTGWWRHCV